MSQWKLFLCKKNYLLFANMPLSVPVGAGGQLQGRATRTGSAEKEVPLTCKSRHVQSMSLPSWPHGR